MGSLMAGWGSQTLDSKSATLRRNRSLTKEEIDAYWRSKKEIEEEHLRAISNISQIIQATQFEESQKQFERSRTFPFNHIKESLDADVDKSEGQLTKKNGWWTKSSWAFLNEPPVMEVASNKYASQFHVANLATSKLSPRDGISA